MAAHNEASAAGSPTIGPAHLVLGLLSEPDALAAQAMVAAGVSLEQVRSAMVGILPDRADDVPALIPYDVDAAKALELTFREALRLGHNYIGTEHVLLALLEHEAGSGPLTSLGIDKVAVESHVLALLDTAVTAADQPSADAAES